MNTRFGNQSSHTSTQMFSYDIPFSDGNKGLTPKQVEAKARWARTRYVRRTAPLVAALAAFKGLSEEQVDALFGIGG